MLLFVLLFFFSGFLCVAVIVLVACGGVQSVATLLQALAKLGYTDDPPLFTFLVRVPSAARRPERAGIKRKTLLCA